MIVWFLFLLMLVRGCIQLHHFLTAVKPSITYDDSYKPQIVTKASTKFSLNTHIDGVPTPKVKWSIQGQPADSVNGVAIETEDDASSFVVASMTSQFAGKVKVTAENSVGSDEAEFDIVVKGKSIIENAFHEQKYV